MELKAISQEILWIVILLAIVLSFVIPETGQIFTPYLIIPLLVLMFFTMLNIPINDILTGAHKKGAISRGLIVFFVISPIIAVLASLFLRPEYAVGLIFCSALPCATSAAFYVSRLGGNGALALILTALSTMLAPILTPILTLFLAGTRVEVDAFVMFLDLFGFIVLPLIAAEVLRYLVGKKTVKKISDAGQILAPICIFFIVFGTISVSSGILFGLVPLAIASIVLFVGSFVAGYLFVPKYGLAIGYSAAFRNSSLGMVIALNTLGPIYAVPAVMLTLIYNVILIPLILIYKKRKPNAQAI